MLETKSFNPPTVEMLEILCVRVAALRSRKDAIELVTVQDALLGLADTIEFFLWDLKKQSDADNIESAE